MAKFSERAQDRRDELQRLRARDLEAVAIINAAFGEYACMIKSKLTESEVAEFEKNFAIRARAYLAIERHIGRTG